MPVLLFIYFFSCAIQLVLVCTKPLISLRLISGNPINFENYVLKFKSNLWLKILWWNYHTDLTIITFSWAVFCTNERLLDINRFLDMRNIATPTFLLCQSERKFIFISHVNSWVGTLFFFFGVTAQNLIYGTCKSCCHLHIFNVLLV